MPTTVSVRERRAKGRVFTQLHLTSDSGVNPLSSGTVQEIRETLQRLCAPGTAHGLLLSAEGRSFSAGADVKEFRSFDLGDFRRYMSDILAMYAEMTEFPKPIVSLVHADALGGGAALAFFSDFVIAVDSARFGLPEVHRGLAGGGYLMPKLIGKHRAAEMVLLGRSFSASDMLGWGLVNEVCSAGEMEERAHALCEELATLSVEAFAVAKASLSGGLALSLREAMERHVMAQTEAFARARTERSAASAVAPGN
jgi:enoyl-CoA hydratase/carnithine racemase